MVLNRVLICLKYWFGTLQIPEYRICRVIKTWELCNIYNGIALPPITPAIADATAITTFRIISHTDFLIAIVFHTSFQGSLVKFQGKGGAKEETTPPLRCL